jgi:hypothetical protein
MPLWMVLAASAGPGTVILGVQDGSAPPTAAIEALGGTVRVCFRSSSVCLVEGVPPERLARIPGVRSAEWDARMELAAAGPVQPTDQCPDPWGLERIGIDAVWTDVCGLDAPVVAIADSGFRGTHVDLVGRIAGGWDYGDGDAVPEVSALSGVPAHGTFIAGLIAAVQDDFGATGVAPDGSLFLQKVADSDGALYFSYAIAAMDDLATAHPEVGVFNYSISSSSAPEGFRDAVRALRTADVVVVAAAANCASPDCADADNDDFPQYPASYSVRAHRGGGVDPAERHPRSAEPLRRQLGRSGRAGGRSLQPGRDERHRHDGGERDELRGADGGGGGGVDPRGLAAVDGRSGGGGASALVRAPSRPGRPRGLRRRAGRRSGTSYAGHCAVCARGSGDRRAVGLGAARRFTRRGGRAARGAHPPGLAGRGCSGRRAVRCGRPARPARRGVRRERIRNARGPSAGRGRGSIAEPPARGHRRGGRAS